MEILDQVRELLAKEGLSVVIASHINPDGDAIGSSLALALALKKIGKNAIVILEPYHLKFDIIPGKEFLYTGALCDISPDIFVALDCGDPERLGDSIGVMKRAKFVAVIDHHLHNNIAGDAVYIREDASSTSQLVYNLLNGFIPLDSDIAVALYTGMVCDTGGFRHGCTAPDTLEACAELMRHKIPFTEIYNELMQIRTLREVNAFKAALGNLTLHANGKLAVAFVTCNDLLSASATFQDLEGIVEFILNIRGVSVAAFAYEKDPGQTKISLRSKSIDVCRVAKAFSGGGHRNAAGAQFDGAPQKALETILHYLMNEMKINE